MAWANIALLIPGALLAQVGLGTVAAAVERPAVVAPQAQLGHAVPVSPVRMKAPARPPMPANYQATDTRWPMAASASVAVGGSVAPGSAAPGPVTAQAVPDAKGSYGGPSSLGVKVLSHAASQAAGVSGLVAVVTPSVGGRGRVRVGVDYSSFAQAYGGDYASRLRLVELPACAVTTPQLAACRVQTPLASSNDRARKSVSAAVQLGTTAPRAAATTGAATTRAGTTSAMVLAVTSSASSGDGGGSSGQFAATSLKASGTWSEGGSSGSFTYSYPISLPPSISGLAPSVGLSYDSGSVDGQTAASQSQSSWVGDGWTTGDNFIEQSFASCSGTPEGQTLPTSEQTGDLCYDGPILMLSLNGTTTSLIWDATHSKWKPANDNGDVVTHVTNSSNGSGTYNTDYWTVTDRAGTVFSFGRNELPGWSSGKATTNSVDYEPVYSSQSGDPCYSSSGFTSSECTMAYRWHLDYVKNLHGNAMSYYYQQDFNYYGGDNGAKNGSNSFKYVRDAHLDHIDYGFTDGNAYGAVPDKVVYTTGERCVTGTCDPLNSTNAANWPDVPFDLICAQGATCTSYGPSFFSTHRLTGIATEQWNGSAYNTVDSWALNQTIPTTGTYNSSTLWLSSVTHTGSDTTAGGSAVTLPQVDFAGQMLPNRVNYTSGTGSGLGPLNRYRINAITTETGSVISVTYGLVDACTATSITTLNASTNTSSCFPVEWTPQGVTQQITDWFNKYTVQSVSQSDPSGGSAGLYTAYKYLGGGAWHYDDNELVKAKYRTYGQWRGYGDVQIRTGQGTDPVTLSEAWYYRGMDGDWLSSTSTRSVSIKDSQGDSHTDSNELAGKILESAAYTYDGGTVDHSTINSYWVSPATATRTRSGLPAVTANYVGQVEVWNRQVVTSGGTPTWRTTETDTSLDANASSPTFGMELYSYSHGDLSLVGKPGSQETCTQITYAPANTGLNLVGLVAETETDDKPCGGTSPAGSSAPTAAQTNALTAPTGLNKATDVISDTRTFYDNPTMAATWPQPSSPTWPQAAPKLGEPSVVQNANGYSNGAFTYQTATTSLFDAYGRPVTSYDADGNKTTTTYTDTSYLTTTGVKATNALGQSTSTLLDPARALITGETDNNGIVSTVHADGLGRTIAVWKNSRSTSAPANELFSYSYPASGTVAPVVVTTQALDEESGYSTQTQLYDALLRLRQTQTQAVTTANGRVINDTFYDTHGWVYKANANYYDNTANPNGTLMSVADNKADQQTLTSFDGLGRPTVVTTLDDSTVKATAYSQYLGDRTVSLPPTGAVARSAVVDALGRTAEVDQYATAPSASTSTAGGFTTASITGGTTQATKYTFDALGRAYQTIDPNGDTWSTTYDYLGRAITKTDPDTGTSASATLYDPAGNVLQSADAAGHTTSYTYDKLNRKTASYDATVANQAPGNEIASWVYDNSNNAVAGMTYPLGHVTTTTSYTPAGDFVMQAQGFNVFDESLGEAYTVPGTNALSGTYTYKHSYTPTVGLPKANLIPAAGGLAQEVVTTGYCTYHGLDEPCTLGGTNGYVQNISYTGLGQVGQEIVGSATNQASVSNTWDPNTGRLTDQNIVNTSVSSTPLDDTRYGYDQAGNPVSQTDVRNGSATETQCFGYDPLDRLNQAWTTSGTGSTCATQPTAANVATTVGDGVSGSAYWTSWTFDLLGQPKQQIQHDVTGTGQDTTTAYTYGGSDPSCAKTSSGAHSLANASTTGATTATSTYCYDSLGNTISRPSNGSTQTLAWNDQNKLATVSGGGNTSTYYYDAGGNVVERTDGSDITVFLPSQQISVTANGQANTRSYPLPGGGQAIVNRATYGFEFADLHGTGTVTLDANAKNPTWQQSTPYGAPRGPSAGSGWLDPNGFLDKPQDTADGLTTVGARQYDTTLGRFISLDPVFETDPQQSNGYTYASSNPVTFSDPTGLDNWWADPTMNKPVDGGPPISQQLADEQGFGALCNASNCSNFNQQTADSIRAAEDAQAKAYAAAQARARAQAEARAKAAAAAAHRNCAWYDLVCQVQVHTEAILAAALIVAVAALVVAVVVTTGPVGLAAAAGALAEADAGATVAAAAVEATAEVASGAAAEAATGAAVEAGTAAAASGGASAAGSTATALGGGKVAQSLIGAGIGGVSGAVSGVLNGLTHGGKINMGDVITDTVTGAALGAVTGGVPALTSTVTRTVATNAVSGAIDGGVTSAVTQQVDNGKVDWGLVYGETVLGGMGGGFGGGFGAHLMTGLTSPIAKAAASGWFGLTAGSFIAGIDPVGSMRGNQ